MTPIAEQTLGGRTDLSQLMRIIKAPEALSLLAVKTYIIVTSITNLAPEEYFDIGSPASIAYTLARYASLSFDWSHRNH